MKNNFNIKAGFVKILKTLAHNEEFVTAVINLLLGKEGAGRELKAMFLKNSFGLSLNEAVVAHRLFKTNLNEELEANNNKDEGVVRKLLDLRKKSMEFQTEVIVKTLKKPGTIAALYKLIRSEGTDPTAWSVLAPALVDSAAEVAGIGKDDEMPVETNEAMIAESMRRVFKHASRSKTILKEEEMADRYGGRMPVNVYTGRFQPFHLGHLSNLEVAAERGLRTVICPVMAGKTAKSIAAHPFNGAIEDEMFGKLKNAYGDLIADIIPISRPSLDCWVEEIRNRGMEPITWTTGMDRKPSYDAMIQRYGQDFNLVDNFEVIGLEKNVGAGGGSADDKENIEGRAVRECLVNDDKEGFMRQMPKCLWDMYDEMRQVLIGNAEPAQATALTEDEIRHKIIDEAITKLVKGIK